MKIDAWKAEDGRLFENEVEYIKYESEHQIRKLLGTVKFPESRVITCSATYGDVIRFSDIDRFIIDNISDFINIGIKANEILKSIK